MSLRRSLRNSTQPLTRRRASSGAIRAQSEARGHRGHRSNETSRQEVPNSFLSTKRDKDRSGKNDDFDTLFKRNNTSLWCASSNAQSVATHAKHKSTASTKKRKSHLEPSVTLHPQFGTDSTAKRRRPQPSRTRANFSPQRNLRLPEKTQCCVQILTFKSHPWCSSSNGICQQRLANHNQDRNFSALPYSSLLYSPLLYSALLLPLPFFSYTSPLPLVCLHYLYPTSSGHNGLWDLWSMYAHANWTQWSLG